jgi:hypothetical protein
MSLVVFHLQLNGQTYRATTNITDIVMLPMAFTIYPGSNDVLWNANVPSRVGSVDPDAGLFVAGATAQRSSPMGCPNSFVVDDCHGVAAYVLAP